MTSEFEKGCCCNKNACEKDCCCNKKCCKICKVAAYVVCTALISFAVVKFTAPCVVHDAFVKKLGEHQLRQMMKFANMDPKMMHHFGHHFDPMMPFPPKGPKGSMDKPVVK